MSYNYKPILSRNYILKVLKKSLSYIASQKHHSGQNRQRSRWIYNRGRTKRVVEECHKGEYNAWCRQEMDRF